MGHRDSHLIDEIKALVPVSTVAARYVEIKRDGQEFVGLSPFKTERTASFTVNDAKGFYHCFSTGENGDQFDLLMKLEGLSFTEAKTELRRMAGLSENGATTASGEKIKKQAARRSEQAMAAAVRQKERYQARALEILDQSYKAGFSDPCLLIRYLRARGVDLEALQRVYGFLVPPTLRFSPSLYFSRRTAPDGSSRIIAPPAMVAALQNREGDVTGVHRTFLSDNGLQKFSKKGSKKILGTAWGSGIWLSPIAEHCVIGEGIETTLTMMAELAKDGERVFGLCGVSLGNIAGAARKRRLRRGQVTPKYITEPEISNPALLLPAGVKRVTLGADADGKDPAMAMAMVERGANKFRYFGTEDVRIATPVIGCDFNDMVGV